VDRSKAVEGSRCRAKDSQDSPWDGKVARQDFSRCAHQHKRQPDQPGPEEGNHKELVWELGLFLHGCSLSTSQRGWVSLALSPANDW